MMPLSRCEPSQTPKTYQNVTFVFEPIASSTKNIVNMRAVYPIKPQLF